MMPGGRGRVRSPRAGLISRLPGGPGIKPAGTMTGVRGAPLEVGAEPAVISAAVAKTHEAWPGSHQGTTHPLGRTAVERRQASAPEAEGRRKPPSPRRALCAACVQVFHCGPHLTAVRLPAVHFLHFYLTEARRKEFRSLGRTK